METRRKLDGRTCTAFEAPSSAKSITVAGHSGSRPLSGASAASRLPVHPRNGAGIGKTRARGTSPADSDTQVAAEDTTQRRGTPKSSSMEKVPKRKLRYDTAHEDTVAGRVAKRARGAPASQRQFTPEVPPSVTPSEQSCEAPAMKRGRNPPACARDAFRLQALRKQAATEKLGREAAEARARALQDQVAILTRQKNNLESQLSSKVREVQDLQQRLDDRKAASPPDSPASDQTASKASTRREADDEQVKQLKQQPQFNIVASAGWQRAAEQATEEAKHW
ncbi:g11887 [Coccomyxa elongata]